ncbi:MAG: hypothetical protein QNJ12_15865 [Ilumatobacter sp.]|uniref:hypothetical protein n=1 Tax=Ilumatobacter sp. TaxID=1967498 RepID=UPI00260F467A|nr:hypothetical protein [Ilumatobacter sp.]MDJ0770275.1 hypothetical protein [Ilumatobacter sp.]
MRGRGILGLLAVVAFSTIACASGTTVDVAAGDVFETLDGDEFAVAELAGEPAVVYFWEPG